MAMGNSIVFCESVSSHYRHTIMCMTDVWNRTFRDFASQANRRDLLFLNH